MIKSTLEKKNMRILENEQSSYEKRRIINVKLVNKLKRLRLAKIGRKTTIEPTPQLF